MGQPERYHSLARQLTLQNLLIIAVSLLIAGSLSFSLFWTMMMQRLESSSLLHATQLASQIEVMLVFGDRSAAVGELSYHADYRPANEIGVYQANADLFVWWPETAVPSAQQPPTLDVLPSLKRNNRELIIWVPVIGKDRVEGFVYIREQLDQEYAWLTRFLAGQLMLIVLVFVGAGIWSWHANRRAFRPLKALTELATEVSHSRNFKLRAPIRQHDDIGRLSSHFNELLKRLEFWQRDMHQQLVEQQAHSDAMQALAHCDELTGINNRLTFNKHLGQEVNYTLTQQQKIALLFIDLDNFKFVNDTFGHNAGDFVLQTVAERLQECVRQQDECYRLGGDEFAILMRSIPDALAAEQLAKRILQSVQEPIHYLQQVMPIGCSIGIALCPENADNAALLLEQADQAMYQAKHTGRNRFVRYGAPV
ncbi:diguanylate cyclase [Alkalimonas delamerensis]|uniref:Diguanylate cyclase n=1 Tax=Alkalimonas delamerensis TaxID=265981 RepID=A0ABT9GRB3_9GAMM|nr:sensor domain-containing diguanylate cyclase [Alkalimonas delamerensis]MDP4529506.1 diguanylate cyclase [Alkalimonas delamerensis]